MVEGNVQRLNGEEGGVKEIIVEIMLLVLVL